MAYTILMALRKTLLPRTGYPEGFTSLQQRIVLHILTHQPFDIVDFILAEIEDMITDGMGVGRRWYLVTRSAISVYAWRLRVMMLLIHTMR